VKTFVCDFDVWEEVIAGVPRPLSAAIVDQDYRAMGDDRPGRPTLMKRWGWPSNRVRRVQLGQQVAAPQSTRLGFVYFIGGVDGPMKVGFSVDPDRRLRALQTANPKTLRVWGAIAGPPELESHIHERLSATRTRGEWFERTAALAVMREFTE